MYYKELNYYMTEKLLHSDWLREGRFIFNLGIALQINADVVISSSVI